MEDNISNLWLKELRLAGCRDAKRTGVNKRGKPNKQSAVSLDKNGSDKMLVDWDINKMMWVVSTRHGREYYREFEEVQQRVKRWLDEPATEMSDPMLSRFRALGGP